MGSAPRFYRISVMECVGAVVVLAHGVILLAPSDMFTLNANYGVMGSLFGEEAWGALFLMFGIGWILAILSRRTVPRRFGTLFGGFLLLWTAVTFLLSFPYSVSGWLFLGNALGAFATRVELR